MRHDSFWVMVTVLPNQYVQQSMMKNEEAFHRRHHHRRHCCFFWTTMIFEKTVRRHDGRRRCFFVSCAKDVGVKRQETELDLMHLKIWVRDCAE